MSDVAARSVLTMQSDASGTLAADIGNLPHVRFVVHQTSGMVAAQLGVTLSEALVRLGGHASLWTGHRRGERHGRTPHPLQ